MKDGAHTHDHGPVGPSAALALAAAIIVAAHALAAIVPVLLLGLAVAGGLAASGLIVLAIHASHWRQPWSPLPGELSWTRARETAALRQAITDMQEQLDAARTAPPAVHHHVHFHGLDPAQVAAILARQQDEGEHG